METNKMSSLPKNLENLYSVDPAMKIKAIDPLVNTTTIPMSEYLQLQKQANLITALYAAGFSEDTELYEATLKEYKKEYGEDYCLDQMKTYLS